jgi:hypothetical protein
MAAKLKEKIKKGDENCIVESPTLHKGGKQEKELRAISKLYVRATMPLTDRTSAFIYVHAICEIKEKQPCQSLQKKTVEKQMKRMGSTRKSCLEK